MRSTFVLATLLFAGACAKNEAPPAPASSPPAAADPWAEPVKRGAPLVIAEETVLAQVVASPEAYAGKTLKTRGTVAKACSKKGCWMELHPEGAEAGVRVTFKDYAFFVPLDAAGAQAVVEGMVEIKALSEEDAKHLEAEGAKITRKPSGEAVEVALVATGVELNKPH
jgi:hypothetical protein